MNKNERQIMQSFGFWGFVDYWSHRLWLPGRLQHWVCDRFDRSLGWDGDWDNAEVVEPAREEEES